MATLDFCVGLAGLREFLDQGGLVDRFGGRAIRDHDHRSGRAFLFREPVNLGAPAAIAGIRIRQRLEINAWHEALERVELVLRIHPRERQRVER